MSIEIGRRSSSFLGVLGKVHPRARRVKARRLAAGWAVAPLFLLDAMGIVFSMLAAYYLRFVWMSYNAPLSPPFYARLTVLAVLMWEAILALYGLYRTENLFGGLDEYKRVAQGCVLGLFALIAYGFFDREGGQDISRGWLLMVWGVSSVSLVTIRFFYRRVIYDLRSRGLFVRNALVVGANSEGQEVAAQLRASPTAGINVVGLVDRDARPGSKVNGLPVLGDLRSLRSLVNRWDVEELILIPTALSREELLELYRDWSTDEKVQVHLSSGLYELFTTGVRVREVGFVPLLSLNRTRITGLDAVAKAVLDYVLALLAVIVLAPLFALIALLVRLDSPGPVIYRRRVVGLGGRVFYAFKFRTMITDAEAYLEAHPELKKEWEETGKIRNDPRITRVGRILRRTSLDELPQLFNVLRGEMSLVGPRMLTLPELRHFGRWRHNLLTVKPGLTGLWQVSGRSDLGYEERVRLDMHYIRNYTIWSDLKLIFNTFAVVLKGQGAY